MEQAGLVIRMPANWRMNRPSRPRVEATVGSTSPSVLGLDALLDFQVGVNLDGEALTDKEIKDLLASTDGLALVRGKWVEIDRERLQASHGVGARKVGLLF
jgi:SNF2 Helicase protein